MRITNQTKNTTLANNVTIASTIFSKTKGLLGKRKIDSGEALIIKSCNSIHSFFMRFSFDAIFVDNQNKVIKALSNFKPWHISAIYFKACDCIELPAGTIKSTSTCKGDLLVIES